MGIHEVRQTLLEGKGHIANIPASDAQQRWAGVPVEHIGHSLADIITHLAGLHAQTEVALSVSAEVKNEFNKGVQKVRQASEGSDGPYGVIVDSMIRGLSPLTDVPLRVGNELCQVYKQIAEHLESVQYLVDAARSMRDGAAQGSGGIAQGAAALAVAVEAHANSFIVFGDD